MITRASACLHANEPDRPCVRSCGQHVLRYQTAEKKSSVTLQTANLEATVSRGRPSSICSRLHPFDATRAEWRERDPTGQKMDRTESADALLAHPCFASERSELPASPLARTSYTHHSAERGLGRQLCLLVTVVIIRASKYHLTKRGGGRLCATWRSQRQEWRGVGWKTRRSRAEPGRTGQACSLFVGPAYRRSGWRRSVRRGWILAV
jgi:hypothetical protein